MFSSVEEANEWLDAIIEHSFDGIYITDGNANTIKANRAYETITGPVSYTHLVPKGMPVRLFIQHWLSKAIFRKVN